MVKDFDWVVRRRDGDVQRVQSGTPTRCGRISRQHYRNGALEGDGRSNQRAANNRLCTTPRHAYRLDFYAWWRAACTRWRLRHGRGCRPRPAWDDLVDLGPTAVCN